MKASLALSALAAALAASLALATPALSRGQGHHDRWQQLDGNGDGRIERGELDGHLKARFQAVDLNGDGTVSFEETEAAREQRQKERRLAHFKAMDRDGDGALSEAELNRMAERMWIRADRDDDDVLTPEETGGDGHRRHGRR